MDLIAPDDALDAAGWARVQILLNLGQVHDAVAQASRMVSGRRDYRRATKLGLAYVLDADLPPGWMFFHCEQGRWRAYVNAAVRARFGLLVIEFADAVEGFRYTEKAAFRRYDVQAWQLLSNL